MRALDKLFKNSPCGLIIGYQIVFGFAIPLEKARCSLSALDNPCELVWQPG
jgi:hypothetical protein